MMDERSVQSSVTAPSGVDVGSEEEADKVEKVEKLKEMNPRESLTEFIDDVVQSASRRASAFSSLHQGEDGESLRKSIVMDQENKRVSFIRSPRPPEKPQDVRSDIQKILEGDVQLSDHGSIVEEELEQTPELKATSFMFTRACALSEEFQFKRANILFDECALVQDAAGGIHQEFTDMRFAYALNLYELANYNRALFFLQQCLLEQVQLSGQKNEKAANIYIAIARVHLACCDYRKANEHYGMAELILNAVFGDNCMQQKQILGTCPLA